MKSCCLECKKDTENINPSSNGKTLLLWKCAHCGSKKSRFNKNQEAKGILSSLGTRKPLIKVPLLGDILL